MAQTRDALLQAQEKVAELNAALCHERRVLNKLPPKSKLRAHGMLHVPEDTQQVADVLRHAGTKGTRAVKVPIDSRKRETEHYLPPHNKTVQVPETRIFGGQKALLFERFTTSVNQGGVPFPKGAKRFRKVRASSAGMHWTQFRRFLGIFDLAKEPVEVKDVLIEPDIQRALRHFEDGRNMDGNKYSVATINLYARMRTALGISVPSGPGATVHDGGPEGDRCHS